MKLAVKSFIKLCICVGMIWYTCTHDIYLHTILMLFFGILFGILNLLELINALGQIKDDITKEPTAYYTDSVPTMDNSEYSWGNIHLTRAESMKLDSVIDHIRHY